MPFYALTENNILDYLRQRPALKDFFPADARLHIREVGDGNLNFVYIIENQDDPSNAMVIKQALPFLRVVGESWPLTQERARYEAEALKEHNKYAPGLAPELFDFDQEMYTIAMEYLGSHQIMRKPMVAREKFPHFAEHISSFLAQTLYFTSDHYLSGPEKKLLQARFVNEELRKLQEDFVYTNPYKESEENNWNPLVDDEVQAVRSDPALKLEIAAMKDSYMNHAEALIHADLHTGSIMINQEDTRVIDPEFAFFGPMGYDVGAVLQNLVLNYLSHFAHTPDPEARADYQNWILETIRDIWNQFATKFERLWVENARPDSELMPLDYWDFPGGQEAFAAYRKRTIQHILEETAGHGGVKFLRRMMGIVSVWDISSIEDPEKRAVAERAAIHIGKRWLMERKSITSIDHLIGIVQEETKDLA